MPLLFLLTLWQAASPSDRQPDALRLREVIAGATRAVDAGRADSFRLYWSKRPASDREAQLALATLARLRYDYPDAERRHDRLLPPGRAPADPVALYAVLGRAGLEAQRSNLARSASMFTVALEAAARLGDRLGETEALLALFPTAVRTAGVDSGLRVLERAERTLGGRDSVLLATLGYARLTAYRFGNPTAGDSAAPAILSLARRVAVPRLVGRCYLGYSQVLEAAGFQIRSRLVLDTARSVLGQRTNDFEALASVQQFTAYRSIRYAAQFDYGVHAARGALQYGERSGNRIAAGWANLNLAQLALRLDDARTAGRYVARAREILDAVGDRLAIPNILAVEGDAEYTLGRLIRARVAYQAAIDRSRELRLPSEAIQFRLAGVTRELGEVGEGLRLLEAAGASAARQGFRGLEIDMFYHRGVFALSRKAFDEAAEHFRRTIEQSGGGLLTHVDARIRLAEAEALAGRLGDAERTLGQSLLAIDSLRMDMSREGQVVALQSRRYEFDPDLGIATIVAEFARRGQVGTAFRIAEATRSRFLWTQMVRRGALGGDTAGPSVRRTTRLTPPPVDLELLRRSLPDSTALLEFVTGRGGEPTTLFVVTRAGARSVGLPSGDSLHADIVRFATALESGARLAGLARSLAARVLDSALAVLPGEVTTLAIVPDGPLHRLPFDALELPGGGGPLIHRFTSVLAPSARLLQAWWSAPSMAGAGRLISVGDPRVNPATKLPALPASGREARQVAAFAVASDLWLGAGASEAALKRVRWDSVRVLHLATHAVVEDQGVMASALYLTPGSGEDGEVGVAEIVALPLDLDLVVLSACRTLGGDVVSGEGLQGLTAPFIEAGARAVAATYWPVGDRTITPLVTRFYRAMSRGLPVAAAMHQAKLETQRAGESASVWAAFAVTGDGWVRPRLR